MLVPEGLCVKPLRAFCAQSEAFVFLGSVREKRSESVMVMSPIQNTPIVSDKKGLSLEAVSVVKYCRVCSLKDCLLDKGGKQ